MAFGYLAILGALAVTTPAEELTRYEYQEPHMGTRFRIVMYAPDKAKADRAAKAAFARIAELNRIMSDYDPASELSQLCEKNSQQAGEPVRVSEELFVVLNEARKVSELSDGAFDVTVRPLVQLWRDARRTMRLPPKNELQQAMKLVGYRKVKLDPKERTVTLTTPGMRLDLGGIAKGYAADEALAAMGKHGVNIALVAAGGDIATQGVPPGRDGWRVVIAPLSKDTPERMVLLKGEAVSTSGDLEQFVVIDGVRYSHIVDPRTGIGLTERKMATVIAPKGIVSDSMTKVLSVLPPTRAMSLLKKVKGASGQVVRKKDDGGEETIQSDGFNKYLIDADQ